MNWGEFKKAIEEKGIKDDMKIGWIEINFITKSLKAKIRYEIYGKVEPKSFFVVMK